MVCGAVPPVLLLPLPAEVLWPAQEEVLAWGWVLVCRTEQRVFGGGGGRKACQKGAGEAEL